MLGACEVGASGAHLEIAYDHARETKVQFQQRPFRYRICGVSGLRSISPVVAMSVRPLRQVHRIAKNNAS
jgi:hypothetical protein